MNHAKRAQANRKSLPSSIPSSLTLDLNSGRAFNRESTCGQSWKHCIVLDLFRKQGLALWLFPEQPVKFELAFNLKTAKQVSVTIPTDVTGPADKIVK